MLLLSLLLIFAVIILALVFVPVHVDDPEFEIGDIVSSEVVDPFESDRIWYHISDKKKDNYGKWWYLCYICDKSGNHIIHNADSQTFWGTNAEKVGYKKIEK